MRSQPLLANSSVAVGPLRKGCRDFQSPGRVKVGYRKTLWPLCKTFVLWYTDAMRIMPVPSLYAIRRSPQSPVACASSLLATSANSAKPLYGQPSYVQPSYVQPSYGRVLRHRRTDSTVVLSYCRTHFGQIVEPVTNSWPNRILSCSDRSQAIGKRPRSRGWRWLNPRHG